MKLSAIFTVIIGLTFGQLAFANGGGTTGRHNIARMTLGLDTGGSSGSKIVRIYPRSGFNNRNPGGCDSADFYVLDYSEGSGSAKGYRDIMYKSLMSAHLAKRQVHYYVNGCRNFPSWGNKTRPVISFITVY